ncbi:MAG: hypothetical protein AB7H90_05885 [Alphaproteobacteria bacterium]
MRYFLILMTIVVLGGIPALAQTAPEGARVRVAGTIEGLKGNVLTVDATSGQKHSVTLTPDLQVYGVESRQVADIKPGDFVASGGVRGTDGKIYAVEVRIFPEALRGVGEGQRPWDVRPEGVMTNATVGTVSRSGEGGVVQVKYKDGQSEFTIGPDIPILAYVPADRSLLKPGASVLAIAVKQPDGSLRTNRITAEKNGVKPPI